MHTFCQWISVRLKQDTQIKSLRGLLKFDIVVLPTFVGKLEGHYSDEQKDLARQFIKSMTKKSITALQHFWPESFDLGNDGW